MAEVARTSPFDPRLDRVTTIERAKLRYVVCRDYTVADLEADLERLLEGE